MPIDEAVLADIRRTRRHPRPWRSEYLHLRALVRDLEAALAPLNGSVRDVLDVWCGSRPYDDLMPAGARIVGLDVSDHYGVADVVSQEFLPFPNESFDFVLFTQALMFVPDPGDAVREFRRVLRTGGRVLVSVHCVWEYDRTVLEHRFTGPSLAALFEGWRDVRIVENGGRGATWATVTARMLGLAEARVGRRSRAAFGAAHLVVNGLGGAFEVIERRAVRGTMVFPPNLLLTAVCPDDG